MTKKIAYRRDAFTLVEMLVVIAIMLALAALAAAFAPRVNDNQKMSRAVDNLEQWLLTAKMRAKRDGLATGLRFIQAPGDVNLPPGPAYSQFQYIQQPQALSGGVCVGGPPVPQPPGSYAYMNPINGVTNYYTGGLLISAGLVTPGTGSTVTFSGVDFWLGFTTPPPNPLVQTGDYLEINGGGVYYIQAVTGTTLTLSPSVYGSSLNIITPTTNYRIIRQPRILIGEEPLSLPTNYAANYGPIPGYMPPTPGSNVALGPSGNPEILFSPTGAVVGTSAGQSILTISVWDVPQQVELASKLGSGDPNLVGIVGVQSRSGFIGAYSVGPPALGPFYFVQTARESGL